MAPACIAFVDMPRMLREILDGALSSRSDVRLIDESRCGQGLVAAADRCGADMLIVSSEHVGPAEVCHLLEERPQMKVFAIADGGRDGCLYELSPHLVRVGDLSLTSLAHTLLGDLSTSQHRR